MALTSSDRQGAITSFNSITSNSTTSKVANNNSNYSKVTTYKP